MKIGVCIRAKDEQKIIADWTRHYINMGFDKIIIYDNMSNPSIEETLEGKGILDKTKIQILIDECNHSNQTVIYQECINNNKDLDWILLCDADEFIWHKDKNIKVFLSQFSEDTSTVIINWLTYGTSKLHTYNLNKTVFEQFIMREDYSHFWNSFIKSFVRPKLVETIGNVHITYNNIYKVKNVYNEIIEIIEYPNKCDYRDTKLSNNTPVLLVHYMTLDLESMLNKSKRNINGGLLLNNDSKYSLEWYKSSKYGFGFKDSNIDNRMCNKYI